MARDEVTATTAATKGSSTLFNVFICLLVFVAVVVIVILFNRPLPQFSFVAKWKTTSGNGASEFPDNMQWPRHVIGSPSGRLGNEMFIYAALLGIGAKNNMTPVYTGVDSTLDKTFEDLFAIRNYVNEFKAGGMAGAHELPEYSNLLYDRRFERLHTLPNRDVIISSYFQSWRYFSNVEGKVRRAFVFRKHHRDAVHQFLVNSSSTLRAKRRPIAFVGVHIRRTDWLNHMPNNDVGGSEYYFRAAKIMMEKLKNLAPKSCLLFVVCSDDQDWARANIPTVVERAWAALNRTTTSACKPEVVHSPGRSASEDMAMLASCNHTIMNIGTYGWWGAWMAGGVTIAYNKYPVFTMKLSVSFEDYYPPDWIVIS